MLNKKTKKHKGPKMTLRFCDPRDDRTAGEDYEDDSGKSSPSASNESLSNKPKQEKQS
jgi:hypothetical protein